MIAFRLRTCTAKTPGVFLIALHRTVLPDGADRWHAHAARPEPRANGGKMAPDLLQYGVEEPVSWDPFEFAVAGFGEPKT
jgi:hypothetical protein